jgi:predicted GNAT family acetyltransferase
MAPTVSRQRDPDRFEIALGEGTAGLTLFVDQSPQRIFFHTEIAEECEGRGLAAVLIEQALAATRAEGMRIVAVCPYVQRYLRSHHDHDDLIDPVTPAALDAIPGY